MIWIAIILVPLTWAIMFKTPIGLRLRRCGEHPRAADTVGISVYGVRYAAVTLSGMLAAAGGAYLSIGFLHSFNENMTAGRGFIALAALIFGNWRPFGAAAACLLFGFSSALAQRLPEYSQSASVLFQALPYVLTLIAVAGVIGRSIPPAAVGRPYPQQERRGRRRRDAVRAAHRGERPRSRSARARRACDGDDAARNPRDPLLRLVRAPARRRGDPRRRRAPRVRHRPRARRAAAGRHAAR